MQPQITIKPNGRVVLHLPGKQYKPFRTIGKIDSNTFYTTRSSDKNQKFNNSNSIGFCYNLIRDYRNLINTLCVNYDAKALWTSPAAILKYGSFKNYVKNDLEMQIFLGLEYFKHSPSEAFTEQEIILNQIKNERCNNIIVEHRKEDDDQFELFAVA